MAVPHDSRIRETKYARREYGPAASGPEGADGSFLESAGKRLQMLLVSFMIELENFRVTRPSQQEAPTRKSSMIVVVCASALR
jgi:hypothetical protein